MEYRLGNSKKVFSQGETSEIACPNCKELVSMSVFSNFEARAIAELPLVKMGNVYFMVCPKCSGVFGLKENVAKVYKKGEKFVLTSEDIKDLKEFNV